MINNRKAYKIFKALPKLKRQQLFVSYEIERVDNFENKKWNNRFMSFWNWLWMNHFKKKHKPLISEEEFNKRHDKALRDADPSYKKKEKK